MRGGDGDAAVKPQVADREIQHLSADKAELEHIGPRVRGSVGHGFGQPRARHAHVVSHRDPLRLELLDEGAADRVGALLVDLRGIDATDVIRLEDLGIEHRPGC